MEYVPLIKATKEMSDKIQEAARICYLRAAVALGGDERTAMVWERCSPKLWLLLGDT